MDFFLIAPYLQFIGLIIPLIGSITLFRKVHNKSSMCLLLNNVAIFLINLVYLITFNVSSYNSAYNMLTILYFGNILFYFSLMLFQATYLDMGSLKLRGTCLAIWGTIEAVVFYILLTGDKDQLIYSSIHISRIANGTIHILKTVPGPIYNIRNGILCALLIFAMGYTAFRMIPLKSKSERSNLFRICIAQFVVAAATFASLMLDWTYDVIPICSALSIFAITWAVIRGEFFHVTDKGREWVLEHTENVFILTDNTYGYLDANLYAKELFPSLKYTKKNKTIPEDVLQYFAEGESCIEIGEKHFTKKLSPIVQAGRTLGYSLLLIDVTYQFEMMEQITEEKRKAEAANHAKSAFMSNMSHEIRTPMNSIVGMTDIALREDISEHTKECLNNIKSSGNALLTIINDILDFSKIEAGKMDIINETYEPMSSLNDISMIFLNRIGDKDIELLYDIDVNLPRKLCGDAQRIRQVIINLMNNAIKFTDCGFVKLSVKVEEIIDNKAKLLYSIEDSGQGIKPEDVGKLFGTYQQVDKEKNHYKEGTGLGLAISKQLVELMGGTIGVESEYGKGSRFYFTLTQSVESDKKAAEIIEEKIQTTIVGAKFANPLIEKQFASLVEAYGVQRVSLEELIHHKDSTQIFFLDEATVITQDDIAILEKNSIQICILYDPMKKNLSGVPVTLMNKPLYSLNFCQIVNGETVMIEQELDVMEFKAPKARVLIVDDHEMNLKVAKGLLAPLQMQVDTAGDGREAVAKVQRNQYHLVLMDHMMPVLDGVAATKLIRAMDDPKYQELPIVALSANATVEARDLFKNNGMNDFVPKPIKLKELYACVRKWLPQELVEMQHERKPEARDNDGKEALNIEGLNIAEGIENSGSKEMFLSLLGDFYKLIERKAVKVEQLLAEGLIREYTIEVHALKSTARMIGAMELSQKFYELEQLGNEENQKMLEELTPGVLSLYRSYIPILAPYGKCVEVQENVSVDVMVDTLTSLKDAIDNFNLDAADVAMAEIEGYVFPEECKTKVEELGAFVADVAMEDVMRLADELIYEITKEERN